MIYYYIYEQKETLAKMSENVLEDSTALQDYTGRSVTHGTWEENCEARTTFSPT
jgi:hypothetical protein